MSTTENTATESTSTPEGVNPHVEYAFRIAVLALASNAVFIITALFGGAIGANVIMAGKVNLVQGLLAVVALFLLAAPIPRYLFKSQVAKNKEREVAFQKAAANPISSKSPKVPGSKDIPQPGVLFVTITMILLLGLFLTIFVTALVGFTITGLVMLTHQAVTPITLTLFLASSSSIFRTIHAFMSKKK